MNPGAVSDQWADCDIFLASNTVSPTVVWTTLGKKAWADVAVREA